MDWWWQGFFKAATERLLSNDCCPVAFSNSHYGCKVLFFWCIWYLEKFSFFGLFSSFAFSLDGLWGRFFYSPLFLSFSYFFHFIFCLLMRERKNNFVKNQSKYNGLNYLLEMYFTITHLLALKKSLLNK